MKAFTDAETIEPVEEFYASIDGVDRALIAVAGESVAVVVEKRKDIEWLRDVCEEALAALDKR